MKIIIALILVCGVITFYEQRRQSAGREIDSLKRTIAEQKHPADNAQPPAPQAAAPMPTAAEIAEEVIKKIKEAAPVEVPKKATPAKSGKSKPGLSGANQLYSGGDGSAAIRN
jgi:uncharacterized membrane protein